MNSQSSNNIDDLVYLWREAGAEDEDQHDDEPGEEEEHHHQQHRPWAVHHGQHRVTSDITTPTWPPRLSPPPPWPLLYCPDQQLTHKVSP